MYQALLTRRYLTSKIMPLLAAVAVLLCTAMVLIVWSVMGGFLQMLLGSGRSLMGDVLVTGPMSGMAGYEALIERLEDDPMVAAATPIVESPALLALPTGDTVFVTATGVDGPSYSEVTGYADNLWWRPIDEPLPKDKDREDIRLRIPNDRLVQAGVSLTLPDPATNEPGPAAVLGMEVGKLNRRDPGGWYEPAFLAVGVDTVTLSVLPISERGVAIDVQARRMPVANQFRTGIYDIDSRSVIVPLGVLQEMLGLDAARRVRRAGDGGFRVEVDETGAERIVRPEIVEEIPARCTTVLVKAAPGVTPGALRDRVKELYAEHAMANEGRVPPARRVWVLTWEERPNIAQFVQAVKKETSLVLFIFGVVSMTAVFLVFSIFWSMISEKTRDIGILRAIGASRAGVAWLFIRYGLALGVVGAIAGGAVAMLVVRNINPIHEWLGQRLGIYVWDPSVYYFSTIPNEFDWVKASIVVGAGALCAMIGAIAPAARAALMDPVKALRFE